jgi:tetratricopeptide (TPR) repeat protein
MSLERRTLHEHPTIDDLEELVKSAARGESINSKTVEHLLGQCSPCRELLFAIASSKGAVQSLSQTLSSLKEPPFAPGREQKYDYDTAFARAESALSFFLSGDRPVSAPPVSLLAELVPLAMVGQFPFVLDQRHLAMPTLVKWLVQQSHTSRYAPEEALHWALMAHLAADSCSAEVARSQERLADLRGFALTQLANALRVVGRFQEAHGAMSHAENHLSAGTGDLSLKARLLQYTASLYNAERKCGDAISLARESAWISRDVGETLLFSQALVIESMAQLYGGDPECAIKPLRTALRSINPIEDPELLFVARHNLIQCHLRLGQAEEALSLHRQLHRLETQPQYAAILPRAAWQAGLLLQSQGYPEEALMALLRAREEFGELKLRHEIVSLSHDLIRIYAELGRRQEMEQVAAQTRSLLKALQTGPETQADIEKLYSE